MFCFNYGIVGHNEEFYLLKAKKMLIQILKTHLAFGLDPLNLEERSRSQIGI